MNKVVPGTIHERMIAGTAVILLYIWTSILVLLVMGTVTWGDVRGILMPLATLIVGWLIPSPVSAALRGGAMSESE